jgi:acetyltransferase-like isoleucine patch superfamily enzyme
MSKTKLIFAILISILPLNYFRIFFYNKILNYTINKNSQIGFMAIIIANKCVIVNSNINSFNFFKLNSFLVSETIIDKFNRVINLNLIDIEYGHLGKFNIFYGNKNFSENANLFLKKNFRIGNFNFFDLNETIQVSENVIIGSKCSFWTHSFNSDRTQMFKKKIKIKKNSIIESSVTILQGVTIESNCKIEFGSIVTKSIDESGTYSSNQIIKK